MAGLLEPEKKEEIIGHAEIRQMFKTPRGMVAGCYVLDGNIQRNANARLLRGGEEVWSGQIASLRRFKEDAREVATGFECGIQLEGHDDIQESDVIEAYVIREVARVL